MQLQKKAYYNLLYFDYLDGETNSYEKWQIENYEDLSLDDIFCRIQTLNINLDSEKFYSLAQSVNNPEELLDVLSPSLINEKDIDFLYLLIFELWRRLITDKISISIFCDQLDKSIFAYDHEQIDNDQKLQDLLENLEKLLNENVDQGLDPTDVFSIFSAYCAYDIGNFLYDYILEQMEMDNKRYAIDLLEGFYPYVKKNHWFFLLCLDLCEDTYQIKKFIFHLLDYMKNHPDVDFGLETLKVIVDKATKEQFLQAISLLLQKRLEKKDLIELLETSCEFFQRYNNEEIEKAVTHLLKQYTTSPSLIKQDILIKKFSRILQTT